MNNHRRLISFIVSTLDRPDNLERFLTSAERQWTQNFEVVVVDQGASRVEALVTGHPWAQYVYCERRGLSVSRNLGLLHAKGEVLVFADDDCVLPNDYTSILASYLPRLQGRLLFGFGNVLNLEDGQPFVPSFVPPRRPVSAWEVDTLCSVSLVFHKLCFQLAGSFDTRFGVGARFPAGEELDLLLTLLEKNVSGVYLPDLVILHPRRSRDPTLAPRYREYGYGQGAVARKHVRQWLYLLRYLYSLARPAGGAVLAIVRRNGLLPIYICSLRGKLEGFLAYRKE